MITTKSSIEIRRPVETVFAFVADQRNGPQWQGAMKEVHVTPNGPPTVGTRSMRVGSFLGRRAEATNEITALEPNRSLRTRGTLAQISLDAIFLFEVAGEGTRLIGTYQIELSGLFKLMAPFLVNQIKHQMDADFQRLKALLEPQG